MQTSILHLEEKAKRLIQLLGLEQRVLPLLPETITESGTQYDRVVISFRGDRNTAEAAAKDLIWWWWVCHDDRIPAEFDDYAVECNNEPLDSPVIYFYKAFLISIETKSESGNTPNPRTDVVTSMPNIRLSLEEGVNKLITETGKKDKVDVIITDGRRATEMTGGDWNDIKEIAIFRFKDANRAEAVIQAKDLLWLRHTKDKEFQGYTVAVDTGADLDMPIIYFYRETE